MLNHFYLAVEELLEDLVHGLLGQLPQVVHISLCLLLLQLFLLVLVAEENLEEHLCPDHAMDRFLRSHPDGANRKRLLG